LLLLCGAAQAQTSPGFLDNATLCANYPNTACQGTPPVNPLSLNQAFQNKTDYPITAAPGLPASAGAGGLYVCVDVSGNLYKKASCP
jgi:hypothetical protein